MLRIATAHLGPHVAPGALPEGREVAGDRPWTDYAQGADCTGGNCDRRADYLRQGGSEPQTASARWTLRQLREGGRTADEVAQAIARLEHARLDLPRDPQLPLASAAHQRDLEAEVAV